jgi:hypothetical protein
MSSLEIQIKANSFSVRLCSLKVKRVYSSSGLIGLPRLDWSTAVTASILELLSAPRASKRKEESPLLPSLYINKGSSPVPYHDLDCLTRNIIHNQIYPTGPWGIYIAIRWACDLEFLLVLGQGESQVHQARVSMSAMGHVPQVHECD